MTCLTFSDIPSVGYAYCLNVSLSGSSHDYSYLGPLLFSLLVSLPSWTMDSPIIQKSTAHLSLSEKLKHSLSVTVHSLTMPKKVERLLLFTNTQRIQTQQTSKVRLLQSPLRPSSLLLSVSFSLVPSSFSILLNKTHSISTPVVLEVNHSLSSSSFISDIPFTIPLDIPMIDSFISKEVSNSS